MAILVVVPTGEAGADSAREVSDAVDNEAGEQGVTPELRVLSKRRDVPVDRADIERLGFPPSDDVLVGVVECDEADRPTRVVDRIPLRDAYPETAAAAVTSARQWAGR